MSVDAMKQALEHLDLIFAKSQALIRARDVLREAIQQAEQAQPVGWYDSMSGQMDFTFYKPHRKPSSPSAEWIPVYKSPTPTPRQPLTHPQIHELDWPDGVAFEEVLLFVRAIEAAHGIKGEA